MFEWDIQEIVLPLKYSWKISRNSSSEKRNFIVSITGNSIQAFGEVAPNVRYGETPALILEKFNEIKQDLTAITTLDELIEVVDRQDIFKSLRFGIESSFVHYLAKKNSIPVYQQLGLTKPTDVYTSYTLPIMEIGEVKGFIKEHNLLRFSYLKVKISQENGYELIKEIARNSHNPLRIDANEAWQDVDSLLVFMEKLSHFPIEFIEQPLPSSQIEEYKYLKPLSKYLLVGDESITDKPVIKEIAAQFHGVNMKLMKAGGYLNGIRILQEARREGLKTMVGCMVETSLGIFSAINLCNDINYIDLDGHFLIENEPFKLVTEMDGRLNIVT